MANRADSSHERFREVNVTFERRRSTRCVPIPTARAAITRKLTRCSTIKISYFSEATVATAQNKMEETAPPVEAGDDTSSNRRSEDDRERKWKGMIPVRIEDVDRSTLEALIDSALARTLNGTVGR